MSPSASVLLNRLIARGKFRHLQVLLKLAELGSVQRTAESIGMSQPSVTQTLAYLERLLDVALFERHARGVRPTPACADLLPVARHVVQGIAEGAEVLVARQQRDQSLIRLGASAAAIHGFLLQELPRFGARHPGVQVLLTETEGDDQLLAIARGQVDLVACRKPPVTPEGWQFAPLVEDRLAVVCRADHPASRRRHLRWKDLADHTWLTLPAGTAARERFEELASAFPHPPRAHAVVTRSQTALWWLLRHEDVIAYLSLNLVRPLIDVGEIQEVDVRPTSRLEPLGLLRPAGAVPEATALFCAHLREHGTVSPLGTLRSGREAPAPVNPRRSRSASA